MTQESKDLLLKDLSGRFPYEVKIEVVEDDDFSYVEVLDFYFLNRVNSRFYKIKPYLFPLSSMREEDLKSLFATIYNDDGIKIEVSPTEEENLYEIVISNGCCTNYFYSDELLDEINYIGYDWLNAHHYDYRGLITLGLAYDATNLNIY